MFTLLENAQVFAPEPLGTRHVLVAGARIAWIGAEKLVWPREVPLERVDVAGMRVIPGLIDGHAHITGGGGESGASSKVPPLALSRFTTAGVTSVVGLLGTDDTTRTTSELVTKARGLRDEGLSAWCWTGGYHVPPTTFSGSVRSDLAHVDLVIGAGEIAVSDHRSSQPTFDELVRLASECHVGGLMTGKAGVLHLHMGDGKRGLELVRRALDETELPPRVFHPTHVNRKKRLFDEALELARRGATIDVTAYPVAKGEDAWSAADALVAYWASGLAPERITVSSDGGGCLPTFDADGRVARMDVGTPAALLATVRELLERGYVLDRVLPAFTSNVARLLRLPGKGRIELGADADLVVLDAAGALRSVMALGAWHVRDGTVVRRGMFERS
ncbi:MAG: beta-aspartyl-peptidase [Planctomycetes bacterium]|nr:beta-aspartyl-peptidase [Planctomycetota bacterium]